MRLHQLRAILEGIISGLAGEFAITMLPREERITWHINEGQPDALVLTIADDLIALLHPNMPYILPYGDGDILRVWTTNPNRLLMVVDHPVRQYHIHPNLRQMAWHVQVVADVLATYVHLQKNYRSIWGRKHSPTAYQLELSA